tara:strand:- start:319 stop:1203 length:885 start_codon:yes stop_codon:yes gene_type:complete
MKIKDRLYDLVPILILSFLFRMYAAPYLVSDERELVKKFLYNDNYSNVKPFLWIYIPQDENCRQWQSFNERKSSSINTPYIEYTVSTIIKKNKDFFNVCVISDDNFSELIPNWDFDMTMFSGEKKERIRELAKQKILYYYGGLLVPSSLLCLKSLRSLYVYSDSESFKINCDKYESIYGSKKYSKQVKNYIEDIESYVNIMSSEIEFEDALNKTSDYYFMEVTNKLVGVKDKNDKIIQLNTLLGDSIIPFSDKLLGIYIPRTDIKTSIKYGWFQYESVLNISNSSIYIAKYFEI